MLNYSNTVTLAMVQTLFRGSKTHRREKENRYVYYFQPGRNCGRLEGQ